MRPAGTACGEVRRDHLIFPFGLGCCWPDRSDLESCHGRHSYRGRPAAIRAYSYPPPIEDAEKFLRQWGPLTCDPRFAGIQLWPEGRPRQDLRILCAGCGSSQAALIALSNPDCAVLGVDLSETSLAHSNRLRDRHSLANLELRQMSLLDVAS